ncbi:MAG: ATP-dependent Clp protease adaptor ClpS, partial [Promethearchaeia archaeon]
KRVAHRRRVGAVRVQALHCLGQVGLGLATVQDGDVVADVDKVMHLLPACVLCSQPPGAPWAVPAGANHSRLRLTARYRPRSSDNSVALQANELDRKEAVDKEPIWRVLLHNDDVHTFDYVIDTIVSVVRTVTRKKAHRITMEAHKSGLATVTTTWKQLAREYSLGLQKAGLTSSIAPDKSNSC